MRDGRWVDAGPVRRLYITDKTFKNAQHDIKASKRGEEM